MKIEKLIIGAPFGNYINFPHTTSTIGTFTAKYRGGFWKRIWKVLTTVRYYPGIQVWKNKLGLPNPGIESIKYNQYPDKIISVMGFNLKEWQLCVYLASYCNPLAIELNVSCPNCPGEDQTNYKEIFKLIKTTNIELIVKLPPIGYESIIDYALEAGIRSFHACNTYPTSNGGLSGKPFKIMTLACIKYLKKFPEIKRIIGGQGITHIEDAKEYLNNGCNNVSVASVLFNLFNYPRIKKIAKELYENNYSA